VLASLGSPARRKCSQLSRPGGAGLLAIAVLVLPASGAHGSMTTASLFLGGSHSQM